MYNRLPGTDSETMPVYVVVDHGEAPSRFCRDDPEPAARPGGGRRAAVSQGAEGGSDLGQPRLDPLLGSLEGVHVPRHEAHNLGRYRPARQRLPEWG